MYGLFNVTKKSINIKTICFITKIRNMKAEIELVLESFPKETIGFNETVGVYFVNYWLPVIFTKFKGNLERIESLNDKVHKC
jgi:hypothetical protein